MADLGASSLASAISVSGAVLLVLAAGAKLRSPQPTAELLRRWKLPAGTAAVRSIAAAELVIAALSLLGGVAVLPLALAYAIFALISLRLLRTAPGASCGCFGAAGDSPVTALHVLVTAALAVAATAGMWSPPGWTVLRVEGLNAGVLAAQTGLITALLYATLAIYPQLVLARGKVTS